MQKQIPSFKRPPVLETVLGVEFAPLNQWDVQHFGLYWSRVRADFPKISSVAPVASQIEQFPLPVRQERTARIEVPGPIRCWYESVDGHQLVQVQPDRFVFNWRKGDTDTEYPRFDDFVRPRFEERWLEFLRFLSDERIAKPSVLQCDVTYVNHIFEGEQWHSVSDWHRVFTFLAPRKDDAFLPSTESGRHNLTFAMPNEAGRLRVSVNHGIDPISGRGLIAFQLSARVRPQTADPGDVVESLKTGREWVVRGFTDLTTSMMHEHWGRER